MIDSRTVREVEAVSPGRWPAPPLALYDRHGRHLARPYPVGRRRWQTLAALAALFLATWLTDTLGLTGPIVLAIYGAGAVAGIAVATWLTPTPHPTFVTHGHYRADQLEAGHWIRLADDTAVQAVNVGLRRPDTLGDPTPPVIVVRASDDGVYNYRPHDTVAILEPIDVR